MGFFIRDVVKKISFHCFCYCVFFFSFTFLLFFDFSTYCQALQYFNYFNGSTIDGRKSVFLAPASYWLGTKENGKNQHVVHGGGRIDMHFLGRSDARYSRKWSLNFSNRHNVKGITNNRNQKKIYVHQGRGQLLIQFLGWSDAQISRKSIFCVKKSVFP